MEKVRFSVFADLHYRVDAWNGVSERLEAILARAERKKADFVMHCGDFCHDVVAARRLIDRYNDSEIPAYHTMGNHDFERTDGLDTVLQAYGMKRNYYYFDRKGIRFVSLDTNYYRTEGGEVRHYADSDVYAKCHQKELLIPEEEMAFLRETIASSPGPLVLFSHGSVARPGSVANREEVLALLESFSRRNNRVLLWINGHHHRNNLQIIGNTAFFDLNSTTSTWVNHPHRAYPRRLMETFEQSEHELLFARPVHAVVTVSGNGEIKIEGMKGRMYRNVTPEQTGDPKYDAAGLPCDASVLSAHFRLQK